MRVQYRTSSVYDTVLSVRRRYGTDCVHCMNDIQLRDTSIVERRLLKTIRVKDGRRDGGTRAAHVSFATDHVTKHVTNFTSAHTSLAASACGLCVTMCARATPSIHHLDPVPHELGFGNLATRLASRT